MRNAMITAVVAAFCLFVQTIPVSAQQPEARSTQSIQQGSVAGIIKDPSGAVLTAATVELRNLVTGKRHSQTTDSQGRFHFAELDAGRYELTSQAQGFTQSAPVRIEVEPGREASANLTLRLAAAHTTVQVAGIGIDSLAGNSVSASAAERGQARNSAELLSETPGISLRGNGELASVPMLHGFGDERAKIVVDGVTVGNSCPNHMNPPLSYMPPAQVAQVTVMAGITPVSLGGDSLGGTIAVDSGLPAFADPGQIREEGSVTSFYRSNGDGYGGSASEWVAGHTFGFGYTGNWATTDDYTDGAGHKVTSTYSQTTEHTLTLAAQHHGNLFVLQAGLRHTPYEGFANAQMDMVRNYAETLNLRYRRAIGSGTLEARVYWQNSFHEMNVGHDKSTFPMPMFMPMNTHGRDLGYSVRYELPLGAQHTLRVGNELHRFALDDRWPPVAGTEPYMAPDTFVNINGGHRVRLGSYAELGSRWSSKWTTLLGLRNDTVWTNTGAVQGYSMVYATDAAAFNAARRGKSDANIDLTAQARYDATDIASFEFGYARKSRAPNLYERYAWSRNWMASGMIGWFGDGNYYVGNIDLKPEIGHTFSGTLVLRGRGAHAWEVKLTPYLTYVQEYIDVNTLDATTYGMSTFAMLQFANHNARLFGGDVSGKMALWDGAAGRGSIEAIGNWVHGSRTDTGNGLYQMMPLNLKVKLDEQFRALTAGFGIEAVDRKSRLDPNRFEQATAGYALFNLHAGYRRGPVEGSFRVDNLFNRAYALPLGGVNFDDFMASMWMGQIKPLTGRGRSASLSLNVRL